MLVDQVTLDWLDFFAMFYRNCSNLLNDFLAEVTVTATLQKS